MDDLHRVAQALSVRLGRAVAIDDPQLNLLAHTAHDEQVDEHRITSVMRMRASDEIVAHALAHGIATASGPVRVAGRTEIGLLPRVCVPVRCQGLLLGYLWLIDPDSTLTDDDLAAAGEAADAAGDALFKERQLDDERDARERELLTGLLGEDPAGREVAAGALVDQGLLPPDGRLAVVVVELTGPPRAQATTTIESVLRRAAQHAAPMVGLVRAHPSGEGVLLLAGALSPTPAQLASIARDVRQELLKAFTDGVRVGIGPLQRSPVTALTSADRARDALHVAANVPEFGPVVSWDELGVYRVLARLPVAELGNEALPEGLRQLIAADHGGPLLSTLETWLDEGGDPRATIARLNIHRTSLYYRISRIEEITGMRLGNGLDRLALHLGLKLARLQGLLHPPS